MYKRHYFDANVYVNIKIQIIFIMANEVKLEFFVVGFGKRYFRKGRHT